MGADTKIEWCDHTFNPWIGCTKVSPACDHCYAEALARRYGWAEWGAGKPRTLTSDANWKKPLAWNRAALRDGVRRRVFCASLADIFDAEVPDAWRGEFFAQLVDKTPQLDWLLLTKRPQVAAKWFAQEPAPANVWLGTTVEDQKMADLRIPILLSIKVAKRFLSCEPLLGAIDLRAIKRTRAEGFMRPLDGRFNRIDWVIAGGESGAGARPSHPDWFRTLRSQCTAACVPFFFKQWGEYAPCELVKKRVPLSVIFRDGHHVTGGQVLDRPMDTDGEIIVRAGKAAAGAMLDGREWREFPS